MDPLPPKSFPIGKKELLFGLSILPGSLLLVNSVIYGGFYLGFAIAAVMCVLAAGLYLLYSGQKLTAYPAALLGLSLVIAASFARSDDGFVKLVMLCFLFVGVNLGFSLLAGKNRYGSGGVASLLDAFSAFFERGIGDLPLLSRGLGDAFRNSGRLMRKGGAVALGLGIAVPVLLIIVPLLIQADAAFEGLLAKLPDISLRAILVTVILGGVLAFVLFTQGVALHSAPAPQKRAFAQQRGLSAVTVNTVLAAVCVVYCVYLASQLAYFAGGFSGILPEEYTLAQYARRGFFEMAWLCGINLGILILSLTLCGTKDPSPKSTRILCLFIGVVTLFLTVASSAKMLLYIESYGLTRLRLLTQIIILYLGLVTVLVCVWLFVSKLPYMKAVLLAGLTIGAAVSWADVDTQVARYNVNAYLDGRMESVDVRYLNSLGDGAVPHILRLSLEAPDEEIAEDAAFLLENRRTAAPEDFREWNYASFIAAKYTPMVESGEQWSVAGILFPRPEYESFEDTHGGFLGDGISYGAASFSREDGGSIVAQIQNTPGWQPFPLSDSVSKLLYGYYSDAYSYQSPFFDMDTPVIENGYYYFCDRHADSTDPYDADAVFDRASYNLTLALYDTDSDTLYYWELDT